MLRFRAGLAIAVVAIGAPALAVTPKPAEKASSSIATAPPPVPERKAATTTPAPPPVPDVWTPAEIAAAKAQCAVALKGLNVLVSYEEPIKDGECGNPAPIRLVKLDNVTFQPAALVNCGMLAPLHTWITRDLQPAARRQLGAKITGIEVMSDYSCRTAFGRVGKKLSQHAYVDALDIRGFVTDKNQQVSVLEGWGATNRDIAAAKAREEKIVQAAQAAAKPVQPTNEAAPAAGKPTAAPGGTLAKPTARAEVDVVTAILPGGSKRQQVAARLGGPPDKITAADKPGRKSMAAKDAQIASLSPAAMAALARPANTPRARFLREVHAAACRIFGTTLGPEANEMHRNHFHVDMAERKIKKICD